VKIILLKRIGVIAVKKIVLVVAVVAEMTIAVNAILMKNGD
jgi:hypothetical protein